jgi:hypothetical protein
VSRQDKERGGVPPEEPLPLAETQGDRNLRVALGAHYGTLLGRLSFALGVGGGGLLLAILGDVVGERWLPGALLCMTLGMLGGFLLTPVAGRRRVARETAWLASQPFPLSGYLEVLRSLPQPATGLLARVHFTGEAPPLELVRGLLGRVDPLGAVILEGGVIVLRGAPISGSTEIHTQKVPVFRNHRLIPYVHGLVEQVLAPLHARYPIGRIEFSRVP